jgi:TRAP-type uncharacterized transport system fused permease subunit
MMRFGYRPAFAGAVEATASMGGQIMPPVMGAVAFIMAETLDVPYSADGAGRGDPGRAVLPVTPSGWCTSKPAARPGGPAEGPAAPTPWRALQARWYLILPLVALVVLLFSGYTPLFAGTVGLALTAMLILGRCHGLGPVGRRRCAYRFWPSAGPGAPTLPVGRHGRFWHRHRWLVARACSQGGRPRWCLRRQPGRGRQAGAAGGHRLRHRRHHHRHLTLTGAAHTSPASSSVGEKNLFLSLLLTMLVCLVLGMGIPTIPNYIITSAIAAPALLKLGVPLIVSHMFVFYFGIMADLTPPVALAAFAASSIAKESPMKIGFKAVSIAIAGFVVPYMAVYDPALMLQGDPSVLAVVYVVGKALLAIALWGAAAIGYLRAPLAVWERVVAAVGAGLLVAAVPLTDQLGFAVAALFIGWHWLRSRKPVADAA